MSDDTRFSDLETAVEAAWEARAEISTTTTGFIRESVE